MEMRGTDEIEVPEVRMEILMDKLVHDQMEIFHEVEVEEDLLVLMEIFELVVMVVLVLMDKQ